MVKIRDLKVCTGKKKSIETVNLGLLACVDHGQTSEVCASCTGGLSHHAPKWLQSAWPFQTQWNLSKDSLGLIDSCWVT